ncbi:MAG: hypothetical protein UV73_C0004G0078 [Candidatus Gottesmanbacteria bacterium GW2011_GWA2_43_14]|uniref:Uncharacterized protein n=1 Tax=Candidatus Gottesmanbacteria bacterium GW2011_GWA2_43_14 TaxID=1618443 RepID=A0A0G1FSD8_9BACT|nr:MAG: hypothetical protein UV73_C0004G0078 [Candidatus Gottesmanbacteria bacterium GW2011_GWA2_43_14]
MMTSENPTPHPQRSEYVIRQSLNRLTPVFRQLWRNKNLKDTPLLPLESFKSGYGLPVSIGLKQIAGGYVYGLFEDRGAISPTNPILPIGQLVIEKHQDGNLSVCTAEKLLKRSDAFLNEDIYFKLLLEKKDQKGISIGLNETYEDKRNEVLKRIGFENVFDRINRKKLEQVIHTREGLGTMLLDMYVLTGLEDGQDAIEIRGCNPNSQALIEKSGYEILEQKFVFPQILPNTPKDKDIKISIPKTIS